MRTKAFVGNLKNVPSLVDKGFHPTSVNYTARGFGMRVVGGKPDASGRREAVIVWTVPGGPADLAGLQQGDKVTNNNIKFRCTRHKTMILFVQGITDNTS